MKTLIAVALIVASAARAHASLEAVSAGGEDSWRAALAREAVDPAERAKWAKMAEDAKRGRLKASEDDAVRWDFATDDGMLTMTLSRKTLARYEELYQRWEEDPALRLKYGNNAAFYLGGMNGRVGAAMIDVMATTVDKSGAAESLPLTGQLVRILVETMKVGETIDSGNFDLFGSDVDDFFRDRFHHGRNGAVSGMTVASASTRRRVRVRVSPRADLKDSKVGLVYVSDLAYGPLDGWRLEMGADTKLFRGAELVRAWTGVSRPWPTR